jgi:hypothetical protein
METANKDNYIEWIELMEGLSQEERNKLEKEDIRYCRTRYRIALISHSEVYDECKKRGRKSATENFYTKASI